MEQKQEQSIGALWNKKGKNGDFMSGVLELDGKKIQIVCFANKYADGKKPDWKIFKSRPMNQQQTENVPF